MITWDAISLGSVGTWLSGGTPSKARPELWSGPVPWVSPKDMKRSRLADAIDHVSEQAVDNGTQLAPEKSLLMVVRGMILAHTFPVAMALRPMAFNQDVKVLVPHENFDSEFLLQWLQAKAPEVLRLVDVANHGTKRLPSERLFALDVPIPPLWEQRKIAAILSSVDDAIEGTQAVIDQLQVVKKAMMAELLTRGLPGRHTRFKQTEIGEVPEGWALCSIDDLGLSGEPVVRTGPFGSSMKTKDFRPHGVQVLTIQSLGEGEILHGGLFFVDEEKAAELSEYKVRANDVVFSRVADIGRCAAISENEVGWLISPNLSRIRLDLRKADARFLMYLITMGEAVRRQVEMVAGNAGRPVITSTTLKALRLPLPSLEEQHAVAAAGRELETRVAAEICSLHALRAAKSALMSALLTGELRVTPDEATPS
jgi:type I restriction enzyme, S subunit